MRGDALGILCGVLRFRARDAVLNDLVGELSLVTARWGVDLRAVHIGRKEAQHAIVAADLLQLNCRASETCIA